MKKDFKTIKNFILLIASALTLVAVTFSWFSLSKTAGNFTINSEVSGSTLAVKYYESKDEGKNYTLLSGDLSMSDMYQGKRAYYRMDVRTFDDKMIKLIMSFDELKGSNVTARYVYFDYKLVCKDTGEVLKSEEALKMSDYTSANVFAYDVSTYQKNNLNDFSVFYEVYVMVPDGESIPDDSRTASLGEVKLLGQQVD